MKKPETKLYTLDANPDWIQKHSDFAPWSKGRQKALSEILEWNAGYAPHLRDENPVPELSEKHPLVSRLWNCFVQHWEKTGRDCPHAKVAKNLEAGKGPDGGDLGGRPLHDLVLCVALCDRQTKAAEHYGANILPRILSTARFAYVLFGKKPDNDWQGDFYCYLVEVGREKDRPLDRFLGLSGLVPWLRKSLVGFLRDRFRKDARYREKVSDEGSLGDDPNLPSMMEGFCDKNGTPLDLAAHDELTALIRECIQEALASLTKEERLRIGFCYGKDRQNQWIARFFKEHASNTSRKRINAEQHFIATFSEAIERKQESHPAIFECLPLLREEAAWMFTEILRAETKGADHEFEQ